MLAYAYDLVQRRDTGPTPFERLLRRDRVIVSTALVILILLAWLYVVRLASSMDMAGMDMTGTRLASTGTGALISMCVFAVTVTGPLWC